VAIFLSIAKASKVSIFYNICQIYLYYRLSILHHLKGHVDVTEVAHDITVSLEPSAGQLTSPYHIIPRVERQIYLHAITFGCYSHKRRAFPLGNGATIIFCYHEGAMGHLRIPLRHKYGIERLRLSQLTALDYNHKVRNQWIEQPQFRLCRCSKIIQRTGLDELTLKEKCSFSYIDRRLMKRTHNPWKF
jgi:hypothetical protein